LTIGFEHYCKAEKTIVDDLVVKCMKAENTALFLNILSLNTLHAPKLTTPNLCGFDHPAPELLWF
jgi:hypothetical protein